MSNIYYVVYTALYGCKKYGYDDMPHLCTTNEEGGISAVLYWVSFVFLAALMILNLFIGVITGAMEDAKEKLTAEMEAEKEADAAHFDGTGKESVPQQHTSFTSMYSSIELEEATCKEKTDGGAPTYSDDTLGDQFQALSAIFCDIAKDIEEIKKHEEERQKSVDIMDEVDKVLQSTDDEDEEEEDMEEKEKASN
jgi:hypothetical protein